jgi:predicted DNA-binding protein (MmcQ/YjbR family)
VAKKDNDKKLQRITAICLALPSAECSRSGDHATYRVRGKVFAYFLDDHHGDGIVSVCVKGELGENTDRVRREPERFYLPDYVGPRGWFGLRLDRGRVSFKEVEDVLRHSYRLTAPKTLVKKLDAA